MERLRLPSPPWLIAVLLGVAIAASGYAKLDPEGLQAIWLFDGDDGAQVRDSSGNGHHGEFKGAPERVDGVFGSALSFDGSVDWVEMTDWSTPELADFSLGCWVNPADTQKQWANILDSHQEPPTRGVSYEQASDNTNTFYLAWGSDEGWKGVDLQVSLDADEWQHLVGVREGKELVFYRDGELTGGGGRAGNELVREGEANFRIANWVNGGRNFAGVLDEVFLFSRALSEREVRLVRNSGLRVALDVSPEGKLAMTWASMKKTR